MPESSESLKTAVLLCGHVPQSMALHQWLSQAVPGVVVHVVPDLCSRPQVIGTLVQASAALRLVLGHCVRGYAVGEVQAQARAAGLDALGIETVSLHSAAANVEKAKVLLAAAVARARAFVGSKPEHAKPYLSANLSRRSLLQLSLPEYRSAPAIDESLCAAELGCKACVQVCPQAALTWSHGRIYHDKRACEPCGLCVTTCPCSAIHNPALTPAQLAAQLRTLLDPTIGTIQPRGVVFCCQRAPEPHEPWHAGWMPVTLPCVGMAPPSWLLAPLLLGAGAVGVLACHNRCATGQDEVIAGRVAYCQEFLRLIGTPAETVSLTPALDQPPHGEGKRVAIEKPFDHPAPVLMRLAQESAAPPGWVLDHPYAPLGVVAIREDVCTACGRCALACPTGALDFAQQEEGVALTFDTALCTACGQCLPPCPEAEHAAISIARRTDLERMGRGRTPLYQAELARCIACGAPIAPLAMLKRIEALLGSAYAATMPVISRYCMDCRSFACYEPRGAPP
jgi:ferredoxin